jgi:hypothetical protein
VPDYRDSDPELVNLCRHCGADLENVTHHVCGKLTDELRDRIRQLKANPALATDLERCILGLPPRDGVDVDAVRRDEREACAQLARQIGDEIERWSREQSRRGAYVVGPRPDEMGAEIATKILERGGAKRCPRCEGRGQVREPGMERIAVVCPDCNGAGVRGQ